MIRDHLTLLLFSLLSALRVPSMVLAAIVAAVMRSLSEAAR